MGDGQLLKTLAHEKLVWMLQKMYEIRYFEEKAEDLYTRGQVRGTMHLSIGQEASSVGSVAALRPEDLTIHHHRGHGHTYGYRRSGRCVRFASSSLPERLPAR
jgi:pyruvate dehydrogenase E1 component alpha subunit